MRYGIGVTGVVLLAVAMPLAATGQTIDTDRDGLSDAVEQRLLEQFAPRFQVSAEDCAVAPAEFAAGMHVPRVAAADGTVYGQVLPFARAEVAEKRMVEIRYFHLWGQDCGAHGHALDTEHVAVLVKASDDDFERAEWKASYWYAAAHEDTVCDVSQISRAKTLHAEDGGATVWVSAGKHASFLNEQLCSRGCGADVCTATVALRVKQIVNLGEPGRPANGAVWAASPQWPLEAKMKGTNFPAAAVARLQTLPESDIAWFRKGRHPAQQTIAVSGTTADALGTSGENTISAISVAGDSTGNALGKSYRKTMGALGRSARSVGKALQVVPK